jgi:hypothetical protein
MEIFRSRSLFALTN